MVTPTTATQTLSRLLIGLGLGLVLLGAAPALAAQDPPGKADYETAARFFDAEEFEAALPYFHRAYELSGKRPAAVLGLAQCLRALKRYGEAIARYEEYLTTKPMDAAEIEETLRLLRALLAHSEKQAAERAATQAESERKSREAEARDAEARAEAARRAEAERAQVRVDATRVAEEAARRVATEEAARRRSEPPPAPALIAPAVPPPDSIAEDDDSFLTSPVFWVITGVLAAGGGTAAVLFATKSDADPYAGSAGVLLEPKR
jgi:tetratricopeptide (TPR) repeat protein